MLNLENKKEKNKTGAEGPVRTLSREVFEFASGATPDASNVTLDASE